MIDICRQLGEIGYVFFPNVGSASLPKCLAELGRVRPEADGSPCYIVRAGQVLQPEKGDSLMPHTDGFGLDGVPPRLVALFCVCPDQNGEGKTLVGDGYKWLNGLSNSTGEMLRKRYCRGRRDIRTGHRFLSEIGGERVLRITFGNSDFSGDPWMTKMMAELLVWFGEQAVSVDHNPGSLLVWNNWRMIHGRTAYSDLSRELHRYYLD